MSKIVCGTNTGLIKVVNLKSKTVESTYGIQGVNQSISKLQISHQCRLAIAARKSGTVTITSLEDGTLTKSLEFGSRDLVGLSVLHDNRILSCDDIGNVKIANMECDSIMTSWKVGDSIRGFSCNLEQFACGGKEQDLKLWDISNQSIIFQGKNVPVDKLSMRKPICINTISMHNDNRNLIATGTAYHEIRLYDTRRGRRPVNDVQVSDNAITAMTMGSSGQSYNIFAADAAGILQQYDLRKNLSVVGRYRGPTASIRSIHVHANNGLMASLGLDRHLYVHDVSTRTLSARIYLKQALNTVSWYDGINTSSTELDGHESNDDDDDLWNDMESIDNDDDDDDNTRLNKRSKPSDDE